MAATWLCRRRPASKAGHHRVKDWNANCLGGFYGCHLVMPTPARVVVGPRPGMRYPRRRKARTADRGPGDRSGRGDGDCRMAPGKVGPIVPGSGVREFAPLPGVPEGHIRGAGLFGRQVVVTAIVEGEPSRRAEHVRLHLQLRQVVIADSVRTISGRVIATLTDVTVPIDDGDVLTMHCRIIEPKAARNPGGFDYRRYLHRQHIYGLVRVGSDQLIRVEAGTGSPLYKWLVIPVRGAVRGAIQQNLAGEPAGLLLGLLLGEKHRIPDETRDRFRTTGLAHALVISGLHVGLVGLFFFSAFKLCRMPDRVAAAVTGLVLIAYCAVTEMQPPVVRASIMANVVLVVRSLARRGDAFNSLGLAALIILSAWPATLSSLSFQLSFFATAAILGLHNPLRQRFPERWRREDGVVGRWIVVPLCVSAAAQVGTAPLITYHFQQLAPISLLANLLVVPLLALAVALGLLSALTGWWMPLLAMAFNGCNYVVLEALLTVVEALATVPFASVPVGRPGWGFAIGTVSLAAFLAAVPQSRSWWRAIFFAGMIWLNVWVWERAISPRDLQVVFIDVGQGDGAFVRFPNGLTMVVDGGSRNAHFDHGARVLLPLLSHLGVETIDVVVASHPHNDHIGGLVALLERHPVRHYLDSGQAFDSWTARRLRQLVVDKGIRYHTVVAGDSLVGLGGVGALVLHPTAEFVRADGSSPHNTNNGSVVFRLTYGKLELLFTGDIEEETDELVTAWGGRLRADVLKVAHHGSATSSRAAFLATVDPRIAVISVGSFNKFGHPAPTVIGALRRRNTRIYRTDEEGAVLLESDGVEVRIRTMATACEVFSLASERLLEQP